MSVVLTPTIEKYNRETTIDHDYLSWNSAHWKSVNGHENQGCPDHTQLPETDGSIVVNFPKQFDLLEIAESSNWKVLKLLIGSILPMYNLC